MPRRAWRTPKRRPNRPTDRVLASPRSINEQWPVSADGPLSFPRSLLRALVDSTLADVTGRGVHHKVREVAVADEREHLRVLLRFDGIGRRLALWPEQHLPEV